MPGSVRMSSLISSGHFSDRDFREPAASSVRVNLMYGECVSLAVSGLSAESFFSAAVPVSALLAFSFFCARAFAFELVFPFCLQSWLAALCWLLHFCRNYSFTLHNRRLRLFRLPFSQHCHEPLLCVCCHICKKQVHRGARVLTGNGSAEQRMITRYNKTLQIQTNITI